MSKYTTEVRFICESVTGLVDSSGFDDIDTIITTAAPKVFNFNFPIFDENYRLPLEVKILRHFYTREICEETVGLWKLRLQNKLCDIMPYYNQLYKSELLEFNPLYTVDLTTTRTVDTDGTTTNENTGNRNSSSSETISKTDTNEVTKTRSNSSSNNNETNTTENGTDNQTDWDYYSDTPQGDVTGIDTLTYLTNVRKKTGDNTHSTTGKSTGNNTYSENGSDNEQSAYKSNVTNIRTDEDVNTDNGKTVISNTEEYIEHVQGKNAGASYASLLTEFRNTILNIDLQLIEELETLFFGLWE